MLAGAAVAALYCQSGTIKLLHVCACGVELPWESLYVCQQCGCLRCDACAEADILCVYCAQCLDSFTGESADGLLHRCQRCLQCPKCGSAVRFVGDEDSALVDCGHCDYRSASHTSFKEAIYNVIVQERALPLASFIGAAAAHLEGHLGSNIENIRREGAVDVSQMFKSVDKDHAFSVPSLSRSFVEGKAIASKTSFEQQLRNPSTSPFETTDLRHRRKPLHVRPVVRCARLCSYVVFLGSGFGWSVWLLTLLSVRVQVPRLLKVVDEARHGPQKWEVPHQQYRVDAVTSDDAA